MKTSIMLTIGCDLGDKYSELCCVDADGEVVLRKRIPTTRLGFNEEFSKLPRRQIVLEVGTHSPWVSGLLTELGHDVVVANPRSVRLISHGNNKNDANDAELLARLGRADKKLLSPIRHRSEPVRRDAVALATRNHLVTTRTGFLSFVRGTAKSFGIVIPLKGTPATFAKRARLYLPPDLLEQLLPALQTIEALNKQIDAIDQQLEALCQAHPQTQRLTQVSGVGPVTALTFVLTIEDPSRFRRNRDVGPYLGLQPRQAQSGGSDPQLRITKAGDRELRRLLVLCAHHILGPRGRDSDLRRMGLSIAARGGKNGKKRAVVAVARKLSVLLCALWKSGATYQPLRQICAAA